MALRAALRAGQDAVPEGAHGLAEGGRVVQEGRPGLEHDQSRGGESTCAHPYLCSVSCPVQSSPVLSSCVPVGSRRLVLRRRLFVHVYGAQRKMEMELRSRERDKAKQDYAAQLASTNAEQTAFYTQLSPHCLNVRIRMLMLHAFANVLRRSNPAVQNLQQLEIKRITEMARLFETANKIERNVLHIIGKCCDGVDAALRLIDAQKVLLPPLLSSPLLSSAPPLPPLSLVTCVLATEYLVALLRVGHRRGGDPQQALVPVAGRSALRGPVGSIARGADKWWLDEQLARPAQSHQTQGTYE